MPAPGGERAAAPVPAHDRVELHQPQVRLAHSPTPAAEAVLLGVVRQLR
ncbi:MAG: hypothetical protein WKG07_31305 [Hymenobacter sp.]